jgi:Calx-beta domain/IPT/TIG domain
MKTWSAATLVLCLLFGALPASAVVLTVSNTNDSGPGSLRQALADAGAGLGDVITFTIGSGPQKIQPQSLLPVLQGNRCATIDGTTQPGYNNQPLIEIDGSLVSGSFWDTYGLKVCGQVKAVVINNFNGPGIVTTGPTQITRSYLGTSLDGLSARPNGTGIRVGDGPVTIGGSGQHDGNLISGNLRGVQASVSNVTVSIQGNTFGSDALQTRSLEGGTTHIYVDYTPASKLTVGGDTPNYFLGGNIAVESFYSNGVAVRGNRIGVTASGRRIPVRFGVWLYQSNDAVVLQNLIAGSEIGIRVEGNALRNILFQNVMQSNGFGIELSDYPPDGHTPNDPGDGDTGPNNFVNHPVITRVHSVGGATTITGTLSATPNRTYTIELFYTENRHPSGYGEADRFIDSFFVSTDGSGNASFSRGLGSAFLSGFVTATATTAVEGTSEFSAARMVERGYGSFGISGPLPSGTEGKSLTLTVYRSLSQVGNATVDWTATNDTATAGIDFTPTSGTLSFADGEISREIVVQLPEDSDYEGQETFKVRLSNATGGATAQDNITLAWIADNDPPPVLFAAQTPVIEGDSGQKQVVVAIGMSKPAGLPLTWHYETKSQTATAGMDFVAASGALVFQPGETQKTITFTINGDTAYESDESFGVELIGVNKSQFAVVIRNDDQPPAISVEDASVVETDGTTTVQVKFTVTAPVTGSIYYATAPGSATSGVDYPYSVSNLTFANQTTRTVSIPIFGDDEREPDETFKVEIISSDFRIDRRVATVTILDDETGVGPRDQFIAAGETGSFVIDVGYPRGEPAVIAVGSSNPEAVSVPSTVTLPAGKASVLFAAKALKAGEFVNVSVKLPAELGGELFTLRVYTYAKVAIVFEPQQLSLYAGQTVTVRARVEPPVGEALIVPLSGNANVEAPARITIPPGQSVSFTVKALKEGPVAIRASLPRDYGSREFVLFGQVTATPATPTILRISPPDGPTAGGTEVELDGVAFTSDCSLSFGGTPATAVRVLGNALILATTPPHAEGVVDVVLTCGRLSSTFASGFNYIDSSPQITHVAPPTGSVAGGTHVRIGGANLRSSCWPFFDGVASPAASLESPSSMLAVTPPHAAGSVDVLLRCTSGESVAEEAFLYGGEEPAASITTVAPLAAAPGEEVAISGTRFRPNDRIAFGSAAASIVRSAPDRHVVVVPELPPGRVAVNLTDSSGRLTTTGPIFAVLEPTRPKITAVVPQSAPAGAELELQGEGFRGGYAFQLGGRALTIVSLSYSRAVVRLPGDLGPGRYDLDVVNAAGQLASIGPAVTVLGEGLSITSVSVRCSYTDGGGELTITGSGFEGAMLVTFGTQFARSATVVDGSTLLVTIPENEAGPARIRVTRADGTVATWTGGFRYASPFDPNSCSGGQRGGRAVRH